MNNMKCPLRYSKPSDNYRGEMINRAFHRSAEKTNILNR